MISNVDSCLLDRTSLSTLIRFPTAVITSTVAMTAVGVVGFFGAGDRLRFALVRLLHPKRLSLLPIKSVQLVSVNLIATFVSLALLALKIPSSSHSRFRRLYGSSGHE